MPRLEKEREKKKEKTTVEVALCARFVISFLRHPPLSPSRLYWISRFFFFVSSSIHINHPGEEERMRGRFSSLALAFPFCSHPHAVLQLLP